MFNIWGENALNNKDLYHCPNCGSEHTRSVPLVHKEGITVEKYNSYEEVGEDVEITKKTYADGHTEKETKRTPRYGFVPRERAVLTPLAQELRPPSPPNEPIVPSNKIGSAGCAAMCIFALYVLMVVANFLVPPLIRFVNSISNPAICLTVGLLLWTIVVVLLIVLFYMVHHKIKENNSSYKQALIDYENAKKLYDIQMKEYQKQYSDWSNSYICLRCGHRFLIDPLWTRFEKNN